MNHLHSIIVNLVSFLLDTHLCVPVRQLILFDVGVKTPTMLSSLPVSLRLVYMSIYSCHVDPFLDHHLALAPFGQVQAQIIHCPIDLRFSPETCRTRLLPKSPTNTIHLLPAHVYQHTREQPTTQVKLYQSGDRILLDIPPEPYRQAWLSESLARQLTMHHVGSGCEAAWCDVTLHWRHGELYLEAASPSEHPSSDTQATTDNDAFTSRRFYGRISHNQLLHRMEQLRLGQVSVQRNTETGQMRIRAQLENARILVLLSDWGTEILTESQRAQELMADILRDLMLEI
jgi:hypothetical protein